MPVKPIRPKDITSRKLEIFPDEVLEAFNELIAKNFSGRSATVFQKEAVALMKKKGLTVKEIFDKGLLDIEEIYRKAGWKVVYDKPAFNETYEPSFTFSLK